MNKLPDLEGWAIFAKVAETGSFERASHILEEGEAVEAEITEQSGSLRGPIRMSAPMSFGLSRVAPALPGFMARYPDVTLDVDFNDEIVDLITNRFDLAVRISSFSDSSLLARRLCTVRLLLVGAPAYFEQYGRPRHPRDLAKHRALLYAYSHGGTNWHFRHPRQGEFSQAMPTPLNVNNAEGLIPALHAGLGLALQPEFLAWEDLESGTLESVMEDWQADPIVLHIVTPPGRNRPARVQELILYLTECFSGAPWAKMSGPA